MNARKVRQPVSWIDPDVLGRRRAVGRKSRRLDFRREVREAPTILQPTRKTVPRREIEGALCPVPVEGRESGRSSNQLARS